MRRNKNIVTDDTLLYGMVDAEFAKIESEADA